MKIVKRLQGDFKCAVKECKARATTRIFGKKVCRQHYLELLIQSRVKRKEEENE